MEEVFGFIFVPLSHLMPDGSAALQNGGFRVGCLLLAVFWGGSNSALGPLAGAGREVHLDLL